MKSFSILGGKAHVVELPEGATNPEVHTRSLTFDTPMEVDEWGYDYQSVKLPPGTWQIVGMPEVTEEQAGELVEPYDEGYFYYPDGFKDTCDTALESFHSAIVAGGWFLENKERCPKLSDYDDNCFGVTSWSDMPLIDQFQKEKWEQAQSRTLDPELTLVLERK